MFELLYFNQFSSFIVQLRSVNSFLQNKCMNDEYTNRKPYLTYRMA